MRLLQAVEGLAGHAHEEPDGDEKNDHRRRPREANAARGRRAQLGECGTPLGPRPPAEARLGHEEDAQQTARCRHRTAGDHARAQGDDADGDLPDQTDNSACVPDSLTTQENASHVLHADLIGDPGLVGAARERIGEAPEAPDRDDRPRRRDNADEHPGDAHAHVTDDQRELPAVRVRHDPGWHFEQEDGGFHRGSHENELERGEVQLADEVDRHDDPRRHVERNCSP